MEEGFYYSIYNNIESDGVSNKERAKFAGTYEAVKSILSIAFPLIFGALIYTAGFIKSIIIILIIVGVQIVLSFGIIDKNIPENKKTDLKKFNALVKSNPKIKQVYINRIISGLTYSKGAFSYIVTLYIIQVFSNSISLGIFTSIFSLISCIIGLLFAKCIKQKYYNSIIKISMAFTIVSLCIMMYKCSFATIVIYNLCQTFSKGLIDLINNNNASNVSNLEEVKKKFKEEYWLGIEGSLFIGRTISNILFILIIFTGADIMMYIFVAFLAMLTINSVRLQDVIIDKK